MLFVGYDSARDTIVGVANRLRREIPRFYPCLPPGLETIDGASVRAEIRANYSELFLVGHSLGGLILRRLMCDAAQDWLDAQEAMPGAPKHPVLEAAAVRLFSPVSAGFRPAGWLGLAIASPISGVASMLLRRSPAFADCQPDSPLLQSIRRRTEGLVSARAADFQSLRGWILWANPENVVLTDRYDSDHVEHSVDGTNHTSVCKPHETYTQPWTFVESGHP
ncbi:MAG TPA: hypothetical protein VF221_19485 [Chloroflexota bacterium]